MSPEPFRIAPRKSEGMLQGGQSMLQVTGNDVVVRILKNEGVDTAFYLTGGP